MASIVAVMHEDPSASRRLAVVLKGLAILYGIGVQCRTQLFRKRWRVSHRLPCKVVSIGNITLGGTGKTPMSVYMARLIHGLGCRVAIVSRGYKGSAEKNGGGVVSNGHALLMDPSSAGDEPFLMAQQLLPLGIPVIVGRDRVRAGRQAVQHYQAEVIVLDDGFQHMRLAARSRYGPAGCATSFWQRLPGASRHLKGTVVIAVTGGRLPAHAMSASGYCKTVYRAVTEQSQPGW